MEIKDRYFEDFKIGGRIAKRSGARSPRRILSPMPARQATFFLIISTPYGAPHRTSSAAWRMAR